MEKHKFDTFIVGKEINLVSLSEETVTNSNWYSWYNDEDATLNMQQHYFPNTKEIQVEYYKKNIMNNPQKLQLGICHKNDNFLIGVISLSDINYINRSAEFAVIIGEKKYRNLSNFIEASRLIIKHGFESLNLNRIYGGSTSKEIDIMFCKLLGFTHEGISRKAVFKDDKYVDIYRHALLKENYKKSANE